MSKVQYKKITELDVINILIKVYTGFDIGIISPKNIAQMLKTSRYQVDKLIKSLKNQGLIEYKSIAGISEEILVPPYNGYCLSKAGELKFQKKIKLAEDQQHKAIMKHFGSCKIKIKFKKYQKITIK